MARNNPRSVFQLAVVILVWTATIAGPAWAAAPAAAVTDLATGTVLADSVQLRWTAPHGAAKYEIRFARRPVTSDDWSSATIVAAQVPPLPLAAGTAQSTWVRGLSAGNPYHFAIRYLDASGNWSAASNSVPATPARGSAPYWARATRDKLSQWYTGMLTDCQEADHNTGKTAKEPDNPLHWYFGGWDHACEEQPILGALLQTVRDPWLLSFLGRLSDHVWDLTFANNPLDKNVYNRTSPHKKVPMWNESHHAGECSWNGVSITVLDYDNPKWLARLVKYAAHVYHWTGYTGNPPHLHFRSFWFKEDEWDDSKDRGPQSLVDNTEDRRLTRALWYAAWRDPDSRMPDGKTIKQFLYELDTSQAADAMKTDLGKPLGVLPGEIRFDTHKIGGYSGEWWRMAGSLSGKVGGRDERWWDWRVGFTPSRDAYYELIDQYLTSGDPQCIAAVRETIRYFCVTEAVNHIPPSFLADPPKLPWPDRNPAANGYLDIICFLYRQATKDPQFDDAWLGHAKTLWQVMPPPGAPRRQSIYRSTLTWDAKEKPGSRTTPSPFFLAWVVTRDKEWLCRALDEMTTPEPIWLQAMYNGTPSLCINRLPDQPITWNNTEAFTNFAALVLDWDNTHVRWLTYNFDPKDKTMPIWLWSLKPGHYVLRHGPDLNLDDQMDSVTGSTPFTYQNRRTELKIVMPSSRVEVFEITAAP
jgi:hypothetical protein